MLFFYHHATNTTGNPGKTYSYLTKTQAGKKNLRNRLNENGFSFFKDVIANILPALKSLN